MLFNNKTFNLQRYPRTVNRSLRPWSAADELLLSEANSIGFEDKQIALAHDSFGALAIALNTYQPHSIVNNNSQLKATKLNLKNNGLDASDFKYGNPISMKLNSVDLVLMRIPKSADLFQLYIQQFHAVCNENTILLGGFMTRNFTPKWKEIATHYFEDVSQSLAVKKARVLVLKKPRKTVDTVPLFHSIKNDLDLSLKQYSGVFSSSKVDPATQLLLKHIPTVSDSDSVLDLACGNGVIASYVRKNSPDCHISVLDDSFLAISSAKLNLSKNDVTYHWSDTVKSCNEKKFDFILCNPPFHFEYENTSEISIGLFQEAAKTLNPQGQFYIVANTHLNYRTHLKKIFKTVEQREQSGKYEVICCTH